MQDPKRNVQITESGRAVLSQIGLSDPSELLGSVLGDEVRATPLRRTGRIRLDGTECYVKTYRPGAGRAGKVAGRRAPAEVEWQRAAELGSHGFRVPSGLCAVWSSRGDAAPSAILLDGVLAEPLDDVLSKGCDATAEAWLVHRLAPVVARLHELGYQHRDLYACHFLVDGWEREPALIDLARVRHSRNLPRRRRIKDLAAMHYSLRPYLRASQLMRMFAGYCSETGQEGASRRLLRRVLRKSARIARHVPRYG